MDKALRVWVRSRRLLEAAFNGLGHRAEVFGGSPKGLVTGQRLLDAALRGWVTGQRLLDAALRGWVTSQRLLDATLKNWVTGQRLLDKP